LQAKVYIILTPNPAVLSVNSSEWLPDAIEMILPLDMLVRVGYTIRSHAETALKGNKPLWLICFFRSFRFVDNFVPQPLPNQLSISERKLMTCVFHKMECYLCVNPLGRI
jgi:hypothetical protein